MRMTKTRSHASETWKSERSYKPFSARLAFLRGFDPLRWYQIKDNMWNVIDKTGCVRGKSKDLNIAMEMAKLVDEHVTITNGEMEFVGKFGVDVVTDPKYDGWISRKKK